MKNYLILDAKGRALLRPRLAPVVKPRGRNVRMPEPLLHLADIGLVRKRIRRGRRPQGMDA